MKKLVSFLSVLLFVLSFYTTALAASVPAQTFPGNDAEDYTPDEGCIHYQIPNSELDGTHTVVFNNEGTPNLDGPYIFTVITGTIPGNDYTQVLSWSSNFPIYAVIVNGEDAFNLYQYDPSVLEDTNLVAPIGSSGLPNNISHVSIVICPDTFPTNPAIVLPTGSLSSILIVNTIFQIISTILLGILVFLMFLLLFGSTFKIFGSCISKFHMKSRRHRKHKCDKKKDKDCDSKKDQNCDHKKPEDCEKDKDCNHNKDKDCDNKKDKSCHNKPSNYCSEKMDPGSGYSLDCNSKSSFPYSNDYHNYF